MRLIFLGAGFSPMTEQTCISSAADSWLKHVLFIIPSFLPFKWALLPQTTAKLVNSSIRPFLHLVCSRSFWFVFLLTFILEILTEPCAECAAWRGTSRHPASLLAVKHLAEKVGNSTFWDQDCQLWQFARIWYQRPRAGCQSCCRCWCPSEQIWSPCLRAEFGFIWHGCNEHRRILCIFNFYDFYKTFSVWSSIYISKVHASLRARRTQQPLGRTDFWIAKAGRSPNRQCHECDAGGSMSKDRESSREGVPKYSSWKRDFWIYAIFYSNLMLRLMSLTTCQSQTNHIDSFEAFLLLLLNVILPVRMPWFLPESTD